jgi:hypothetical protein
LSPTISSAHRQEEEEAGKKIDQKSTELIRNQDVLTWLFVHYESTYYWLDGAYAYLYMSMFIEIVSESNALTAIQTKAAFVHPISTHIYRPVERNRQ